MEHHALASFASPEFHAVISEIIHRHSENPSDIRDIALDGLDLSRARDVLDLGSGFGFFSEKVLPRVAAQARLTGVDACVENRSAFLQLAKRLGHPAEFHCLMLPAPLPWPNASFDLILTSYALYFFVEQLAEIARVLRPTGRFLTITHSESSFRNLHETIGLPKSPLPFQALIRSFSAENGAARLRPYFQQIERVDYRNTLRFDARHGDELVQYVQFKLPLLYPGGDIPPGIREILPARLGRWLAGHGPFVLDKTDAVFRCGEPLAG